MELQTMSVKNLIGNLLQGLAGGSMNTLPLLQSGFDVYKKTTPTKDFMEDVAFSWLSLTEQDFGDSATFLSILDIAHDPKGMSFFADLRSAIVKDNWHKKTLDSIVAFAQSQPKPSVQDVSYPLWYQAASDLSDEIVANYDHKPVFAIDAQSDLCDAAEEGDLAKVQQLLTNGSDINEAGFMNMSAIMSAVKGGHLDVLNFLLQQPNANPALLNSGGTSALSMACRQNWLDGVNVLLAHPLVDVNQLGEFGGTALHQAAGMGHKDVVKRLLQEPNIQMQATYTDKKYTPTKIARKNSHPYVALMIEKHFAAPPAPSIEPKKFK